MVRGVGNLIRGFHRRTASILGGNTSRKAVDLIKVHVKVPKGSQSCRHVQKLTFYLLDSTIRVFMSLVAVHFVCNSATCVIIPVFSLSLAAGGAERKIIFAGIS
jgi:hypothetical protein